MRLESEDAGDRGKRLSFKRLSVPALGVSHLMALEASTWCIWNWRDNIPKLEANIPWGSASSWGWGLSGLCSCSYAHPANCHSVPAPSCPGGNRQPANELHQDNGACVQGSGNTRTDMKKMPQWFSSGQSNVTFRISRLKSVAAVLRFYFGSGENIFPTVSFFFFPLPLQALKPLLLFSFFIFPVLWVHCLGFLDCLLG